MLNLFALIVLIVLIVLAVIVAAVLGGLPGKIARTREHPHAEAVTVCGWLGLLTLGVLWPVAMIWAYWKPVADTSETEICELKKRVAALEDADTTEVRG